MKEKGAKGEGLKAKGIMVHVTKEMIREYLRWPVEDRLAWLEQAVLLSYAGLTKKRRKIWEKFRRGEL